MRERRSSQGAAVRKRESIQLLKRSMSEDRLVLLFQPIVDLGTGQVAAAEALLRWRPPAEESRSPSELIMAAERSPVIFAVERWVAAAACRQAAAWQRGPLPDLRLNLNLSAREMESSPAVARLQAVFRAAGLDGRRLSVEITETAAIHDLDRVAPILDRLKGHGVELWLDDFGTGHSSLAWLSSLPIDGLKLPGLFVEGLPHHAKRAVMVPALIEMAHRLGLRVVAEGVETEEQLSYLRDHGCDAVQGRLCYDAMPAEELVDKLTAGRGSDRPGQSD